MFESSITHLATHVSNRSRRRKRYLPQNVQIVQTRRHRKRFW